MTLVPPVRTAPLNSLEDFDFRRDVRYRWREKRAKYGPEWAGQKHLALEMYEELLDFYAYYKVASWNEGPAYPSRIDNLITDLGAELALHIRTLERSGQLEKGPIAVPPEDWFD